MAAVGGPPSAPFRPDGTRLEGCLDADCRRQAFGNIAYHEGPKPALDLFQEKLADDKAVEADCHRIAHTIGAASLVYYDGSVAKALANGRSTCWSGYYHGVVERSFVGASRAELPARSRRICADPDIRRTSFLAYQCVHGLGHGLMIHTGYDLPAALVVCNKLETAWDHDSCEAGVFMENISSSYGIKSRWLKDDDLIYPCNAIAERYKLYCYLILTSRVLQANGYDWEQTVATCRRSDKGWVPTCFQSLGRDASGSSRQDPAEDPGDLRARRGHDGRVHLRRGAGRHLERREPAAVEGALRVGGAAVPGVLLRGDRDDPRRHARLPGWPAGRLSGSDDALLHRLRARRGRRLVPLQVILPHFWV